ncbi:MAG: hypothetical protein PW788_11415 [Micavibrio sp.]|nr:hypothetical protein [Micavibrio sp.]
MTINPKFNKRLLPDAEDLIVRAQVSTSDGKAFVPLSFTRERIDYLTAVSEGVSGIVLKNGAKIPVNMPYEALEAKVYFADILNEPVLDLRALTGPYAAAAVLPALSAEFDAAAAPAVDGDKPPMVNKELTIAVFVRQAEQQNFQMFFVKDTNINWAGVDGEDGRNGKLTKLPLRSSVGPFGEKNIIIDISRPTFMEFYNKAKMQGLDELDLREWTRRRDPDGIKPPKGVKPPF